MVADHAEGTATMAVKIPYSRAKNLIETYAETLRTLHFDASTAAKEKTHIELLIKRDPLPNDHYFIPVDKDNLVEISDVEWVKERVGKIRLEVLSKKK
jgi:hypothetical protein